MTTYDAAAELVSYERCRQCGQPVWQPKVCTCSHSAQSHAYGKRQGVQTRTYCQHYGCTCRMYEEVSGATEVA